MFISLNVPLSSARAAHRLSAPPFDPLNWAYTNHSSVPATASVLCSKHNSCSFCQLSGAIIEEDVGAGCKNRRGHYSVVSTLTCSFHITG